MDERLASRWKRLGGVLIDMLVSLVIILPIMFIAGVMQQIFSGQGMTIGQRAALVVCGWVVFLALNGYMLFKEGQTIGKMVMKTKIVDMQGNIPKFGKLLVLRYFVLGLAGQIPVLGQLAGLINALLIFGKEKRCLHDYMAGTRVVEA